MADAPPPPLPCVLRLSVDQLNHTPHVTCLGFSLWGLNFLFSPFKQLVLFCPVFNESNIPSQESSYLITFPFLVLATIAPRFTQPFITSNVSSLFFTIYHYQLTLPYTESCLCIHTFPIFNWSKYFLEYGSQFLPSLLNVLMIFTVQMSCPKQGTFTLHHILYISWAASTIWTVILVTFLTNL